MRVAVITSVIPHNYIQLQPPILVSDYSDYFVITDNPQEIPPWTDVIVRPDKNTLKQIQKFRMRMHEWFEEYDYLIWVDGEVRLKVEPIDIVDDLLKEDVGIMFVEHPWRDCIYEEAEVYKGFGAVDPKRIDSQTKRYRKNGYPEHNGLISVAFHVRDNKDSSIRDLCERWAWETSRGCNRSQMSFNYASWVTKVPYATVPWSVLGPEGVSKVDLWQNNNWYQRKGYEWS